MGGVSAGAKASSVRWMIAAALWIASVAHAQSGACDTFKQKLAARIEAGGVHGYSLDITPASTPLPSGAKVIGTCDGGAYRLVYRRFGGSRDPVAAPTAAAAEPAPTAKKNEAPPSPPPAAPRPRDQEATVVAPISPAPASSPLLPPAPAPATLTADVATVASIAASDPPMTASSPEPVARPAESSIESPAAATPSWATRASAFWSEHWLWICAALLVPLAALLWAWYAHHRDYDAAGLPRGPRL